MARGNRAPSQNSYRGALGRTQTSLVHVTGPKGELISAKVHTTVDAVESPELVDRLHLDQLNVIAVEGSEAIKLAVPVVYHDPAAELLVLVLDASQRHRELDERIRLLERLRTDEAAIPAYVKDAAVVFGGRELREYLERRAGAAVEIERGKLEVEKKLRDVEKRSGELEAKRGEIDKRAGELDKKSSELDAAKNEIANRILEIERMRAELARDRAEIEKLRSEARNRVIAAAQAAASAPAEEVTAVGDVPKSNPIVEAARPLMHGTEVSVVETSPVPKVDLDLEPSGGIETALQNALERIQSPRAESQGEFEGATGLSDASEIRANAAAGEVEVELEQETPPPHDFDEEHTTGASIIPQGSDPLTSETVELEVDPGPDAWLDRVATSNTSAFHVVGGNVRLALAAGEQIARGLGGIIDVRVLLHRAPTYPVITLVLGPPAALRVPSPTQLAIITLDIAADTDRQVLAALAKRFELALDLVVRGRRVRRAKLVAPLSENVGFIIRAAEDHLRGLMSSSGSESEASYSRAVELVRGAGFDLLGTNHPDTSEFRDDKLAQLQTAQQLRRAIAMARRFARPSREDYLVCTRGFPLPRWRELRRHVLESAVAWGLWMGAELAQVAVSEGLARSRRDLIVKLDRGFEGLKGNTTAFDIDEEAADDNQKALAEEARALGVDLERRRPAGRMQAETGSTPMPKLNGKSIASDEVSQVVGMIGGTPAHGISRPKPSADLVADLDDKGKRLAAALELCDRAEPGFAEQVIDAATKMSRAEAVRVLGMSVKFGEAAKAPLMAGLASSKGFLRHGCALALAMLRTEDGTQAVIDLLMSEPTEIWREVARAIGQVGPAALLPLASTYGRLGESATPALAERVAWAMAHVAVRGGKAAVETMAKGQSIVAPVASQALTFHASAANDQVRVRPGANGSQAGRDVTVNRAFSRRFFEALEAGVPDAGQAGLVDLEASQPMEMLDEADLIEDDDEVDLDESDLIQS